MKKIIWMISVCLFTAMLSGVVIFTGCTSEPVTETVTVTKTATETVTLLQTIEDISVTEAYTMIQENEDNPDFAIIDLRTPEERSVSYIQGSLPLDWNGGVFEAEVESLDRYNTYLLY